MAFLQSLKTRTTDQHRALEAQLDIVSCFQSKSSYVRLIERFFTLYEPLETSLAAAADWQVADWDFEGRRKTPWLYRDLTSLGLVEADIAALPRCADLPELPSLAEAIGCLYVLEGSTLGGQVITRLLAQQLEISPAEGGQFFSGYGAETGPKWRQFGAWAEAWAEKNPTSQEKAIEAAQKTFDAFARWFH